MGSRAARDGGSPSASFLIPQLRHSRRGSLASLSSVNQVDKEALSQALDHIHNSASQTETLTVFNEYTSPPSSSSGLDGKGIAGELQGGLSGLYSRFRASVGNVKDTGLVGSEDYVVEKSPAKSSKSAVASPALSTKHEHEPKHIRNLSTASVVPGSDSASGRQSPLSTVSTDATFNEAGRKIKQFTLSLGNREASGKSLSEIVSPLKPPLNLVKQTTQPTTVDPASAEVNPSAVKSQAPNMDPRLLSKSSTSNGFHESEWSAQVKEASAGPVKQASVDTQRFEPSWAGGANGENTKAKIQARQALYGHLEGDVKPLVDSQSGRDQQVRHKHPSQGDSVYPFPQFGNDGTSETALNAKELSSEPDKNRDSPILIAESSISQNDVFVEPGKTDAKFSKNKFEKHIPYQHLQIPLHKSMASPQLSRTQSPIRSISRTSSTDTNTESLASVSQQQPQGQDYTPSINTPRLQSNLQLIAQANIQRDPMTMNVFSQVKSKVLNKKYWMKDENARDCFCCGDSFSAFRRKHHCRICGQIFDAKCTSTLPGEHFGQPGSLRVCKPCESIIHGNDDSSEFSDDGSLALPTFRPRHGSTSASDALASPFPETSPITAEASQRSPGQPDLTIPTMSIPATRKAGEKSKRKSTVLEIDSPRTLARPSSSRSLKSAIPSRPHVSGHRRHNSRHQFQRGFKTVTEESAPFHQDAVDNESNFSRLPAFHDDNIIDPDLAPYLSDDGSSGDEQMSIMAALNGDALSRSHDNERHGLSGLLTSSKKGRSKGDKNVSGVVFASRDSDNQSLHSARATNPSRSSRRRNISVSGNIHMRPSPRSYKTTTATPNLGMNLDESFNNSALAQITSLSTPIGASRMIRSSSMRGAAAPAVELNNASLRHVRRLLHQLLEDSAIPAVASWEKALMPILLRATDDVNPDVQNGDDIDIRHYVKLKKIPGGRPGDTSYVSGLVFTKNLALKSMPRSISHPNILILTFPLEYARHQQHFMSLEPVIRQEREFLQNLVNRIAALRPQLLLVERNISGLALQFLEQANIATAYNVKASVLEAVSRCCQTRIISSIDKLAIKPAQAGKCASFYLKTYLSGPRKKTYMFLSGCAKELGCTIVLRGDDNAMLAKMKRITEFMIYVVYNLKLETCLMRDEFALIPSSTEVGSISAISDLARHQLQVKNLDLTNSNMHEHTSEPAADIAKTDLLDAKAPDDPEIAKPKISLPEEDSVPEDIPMPTFYGDMVEEHKTKILSASPFVKFMQPYLLMRAREQERRLAYLKRLRDQDVMEEQNVDEKSRLEKFDLIKPEMVHERVQHASRKVREVLHAVHDAEYDKALHNYQTQSRQWEIYISGNMNLFDPYAHQNIAVLYSVVCTITTVPCSGPDLLALGFYNEHETDADFEADCTLGQYVEDLCLGANTVCTSNGCEKKMIEHHRQYVHGEAQLSVFVERYPCKLRGLQDTILMWSTCRICSKETQVIPMSENTWKYSFGKYLELSFWSSDLRARADVCPHDLHRSHLRYFGFKDMALRVHYDPITLLEIIVPRARITWKVENDLRFKNDLFTKIEDRLNKFIFSVKARIKSINTESVVQEKTESCRQEVERLSKRAADEHHFLVQKLREKYMDSKHYEVIPLNRAIRATQEKVAEWDNAFAEFDHNFFPSEKDIRRLADLQLKKIFLDRNDSVSSLTSTEDVNLAVSPEEAMTEKISGSDAAALNPQSMQLSSEKAHDMLASVVENHVSTDRPPDEHQSAPATALLATVLPLTNTEPAQASIEAVQREDIRHLDLAVSSDLTEKLREEQQHRSIDPLVLATPAGTAHSSTNLAGPSTSSTNSLVLNHRSTNAPPEEQASERTNTSEYPHVSGIPRPVEVNYRVTRSIVSPTLSRAQSHPANIRNDTSRSGSSSQLSTIMPQVSGSEELQANNDDILIPPTLSHAKPADKKLSDRLGLGAVRTSGINTHSMIPRSIASRRKDSKVSNLAKHFEQLSREFEKERIRDRRQRAEKSRRSRVYPMAASKPIVQVYRNVHEAVEEKEPSDEDILSSDPSHLEHEESTATCNVMADNQEYQTLGDSTHAAETSAENFKADQKNIDESRIGSDVEGEEVRSDEDHSILDDGQIPETAGYQHALSGDEAQLDLKLDLPKHEKSSLMKMLTNFWAERSASGWQPLEYPLNTTDHIFADSDIIVREDEPSSLISFALDSEDYQAKLHSISEDIRASNSKDRDTSPRDLFPSDDDQLSVEESLLRPTGTHLKYQFSEGSARMLCKVFYAEQFDALRRKCGVSERIVESLSRCMKWDSKGGKTKSVFLKTLDDRFVLKSLSTIETQAFLRFAPAYFRIMSESLFHELPSVIAKMLGFYQIIIKNPASGVEFNWFLLVMENLFYDRSPTRIFDLKGSMRNRRIQSTGEQNEVLLDENMVEFIYESPLFSREHSKKLLRASVWNDTLFLSRQNVMDYSLMIAIDENRRELVVGIIDCIRTYTWDKKLESWIKDRGKNRPTVTSPKEYKSRFREAMGRYVLQAPNCWHQFKAQQAETRLDDPGDEQAVQVVGL